MAAQRYFLKLTPIEARDLLPTSTSLSSSTSSSLSSLTASNTSPASSPDVSSKPATNYPKLLVNSNSSSSSSSNLSIGRGINSSNSTSSTGSNNGARSGSSHGLFSFEPSSHATTTTSTGHSHSSSSKSTSNSRNGKSSSSHGSSSSSSFQGARNAYCTMVLLNDDMKEIKGEKQKTPAMKGCSPCWSPLKAEMLRSHEKNSTNYLALGLGAAAASEEYTFGNVVDLREEARYVLLKVKDKSLVEDDDLGRLLLSLNDLDTSGGEERVAWYPLQLRPDGKMRQVQGKIRIASRILLEPNRWQLWMCALQMMKEVEIKDHSFYLKLHRKCFPGKEAILWMLRHGPNRRMEGGISCSTEDEGIWLGNAMIRGGMVHHVAHSDRLFENSPRQFYRFNVHHLDIEQRTKATADMEQVLSKGAAAHEYQANCLKNGGSASKPSMQNTSPSPLKEANVSGPASSVSNSLNGHRHGSPPALTNSTTDTEEKPIQQALKITDFKLLKILGTGSYGRVLSARGPDHRVYAIKIISKIGLSEYLRKCTKTERDILKENHHPFVASLRFAFQNEDKLYMGMDFLNGGDFRYHLNQHFKSGGHTLFTPQNIQFYAAEIVAGLAHVHRLQIIYRDLKAENILIAKDGHIKLVDFGLATFRRGRRGMDGETEVETGVRSSSLAGSPDYIAPEVLMATSSMVEKLQISDSTRSMLDFFKTGYTQACDWWSLGILIFEMHVGRTPFVDANLSVMYRNIIEGKLFLPPELAPDTQSLLRGLIEKDPTKRLGAEADAMPLSIMNHPYFKGMDWKKLQEKQLAPPWIPNALTDEDVRYIEPEFMHQVAVDTPEWRMLDSVDRRREHLDDFTFRPANFNVPDES